MNRFLLALAVGCLGAGALGGFPADAATVVAKVALPAKVSGMPGAELKVRLDVQTPDSAYTPAVTVVLAPGLEFRNDSAGVCKALYPFQLSCTWAGPIPPGTDTTGTDLILGVQADAVGGENILAFLTKDGNDIAPKASSAFTVATPRADLAITGKAGRLRKGKRTTYTFALANKGPEQASRVSTTARLPKALKVKKVAGKGCKKSGNGFACSWASMAPGQKASVKLTVAVAKTAAKVAVRAAVKSATLDPKKSNNTANVTKTAK